MTEYQECFGEMSIPQLREELEYQQSLGYNLGDSVCAYIVDRIAMLKRIEKKPITITVSEYLKFVTTEKSETIRGFIHPFYKSGYWNVFRYFVELDIWLDVNEIKHTVDYEL